VSSIGFDTTADENTIDTANVLADSSTTTPANVASTAGETATSNISVLPDTQLTEAPTGETVIDFADLIGEGTPASADSVLADTASLNDVIADAGLAGTGIGDASFDDISLADVLGEQNLYNTPESVVDVAENIPTSETPVVSGEPQGGLTTMAQAPIVDLDTSKPAVISEAPVAENLLTSGLAAEQPAGGLNAVAQAEQATPESKMATSLGLKPTDITKPVVATVGSLLKQSLGKQKRPAQRAPVRPAGGLQMASARPAPRKPTPPPRMDVAKLIPIQKATPVAPPKTLASTAKLSPVSNIAGLTSLVKKTG
jgi:hypothetical protein